MDYVKAVTLNRLASIKNHLDGLIRHLSHHRNYETTNISNSIKNLQAEMSHLLNHLEAEH